MGAIEIEAKGSRPVSAWGAVGDGRYDLARPSDGGSRMSGSCVLLPVVVIVPHPNQDSHVKDYCRNRLYESTESCK